MQKDGDSMLKKFPYPVFYLSCLLLSIAAHTIFLIQWTRGHYMVGMDDGASQMLPFKKLLYEQYTSGEFFYSFDFGLGAGTFSELSYYFSTSIVFLFSVLAVYLLEIFGAIQSADVLFWANAAVFVSIFRLSFILFITARLFMYMGISKIPALLGASIYGISGMYFRHTVYWEFFADAFLWLPLLLFGIEKIFREQKPGWFLVAVSISLIDNFYFSYINFLLAGIYIIVRLFIRLTADESSALKIAGTFLVTGIIGAGISAVSFVPAVYAYLNNHRPPFEQEIPWVGDWTDNVLFTSRYIVVPAAFLLFLFCSALYRNKTFRLFAILAAMGLLLHFSPLVGSAFNGFSAPQYRWEYFISLAIGGAVAIGLDGLKGISLRQFFMSAAMTGAAFMAVIALDENFDKESLNSLLVFSILALTSLLMFTAIYWRNRALKFAFIAFLFLSNLVFANWYQVDHLLETGNIDKVNKELLTGEEYDDPEIRGLLADISKRDNAPGYRIDWMEGVRNNTPIVQDFRGLSAYSSILNKNLLYFYLYDLEIDMGRESVSRYATLGNRANLHSLLQGNYSIVEKGDANVPFGFTKVLSSSNYEVYENTNPLPFARATSTVFQEQQLADSHPLIREHAMLQGVILDNGVAAAQVPDITGQAVQPSIEEKGAVYQNGKLSVYKDIGGIDLQLPTSQFDGADLYISFHLESTEPSEGFELTVNDYRTTRKANDSVYKTFADDLTIRVPASETVEIRLPKGDYSLTEIQVYEEPHKVLMTEKERPSGLENLELNGSRVEITYNNQENHAYLATAIPFERGWSAQVNGEKAEVLKANYGFLALPIEDGQNNIVLTYLPPFFKLSLIVSVLSLLIGTLFVFRRSKL